MGRARGSARSLAGIRADGATSATFPKARASSGVCADADAAARDGSSSAVPLRGQRGWAGAIDAPALRFPFNCEGMNTFTGTNGWHSKQLDRRGPTPTIRHLSPLAGASWPRSKNSRTGSSACFFGTRNCSAPTRCCEQQLAAVTHERDNLRSRLNAARSRIDVLLERLPREPAPAADADDATASRCGASDEAGRSHDPRPELHPRLPRRRREARCSKRWPTSTAR